MDDVSNQPPQAPDATSSAPPSAPPSTPPQEPAPEAPSATANESLVVPPEASTGPSAAPPPSDKPKMSLGKKPRTGVIIATLLLLLITLPLSVFFIANTKQLSDLRSRAAGGTCKANSSADYHICGTIWTNCSKATSQSSCNSTCCTWTPSATTDCRTTGCASGYQCGPDNYGGYVCTAKPTVPATTAPTDCGTAGQKACVDSKTKYNYCSDGSNAVGEPIGGFWCAPPNCEGFKCLSAIYTEEEKKKYTCSSNMVYGQTCYPSTICCPKSGTVTTPTSAVTGCYRNSVPESACGGYTTNCVGLSYSQCGASMCCSWGGAAPTTTAPTKTTTPVPQTGCKPKTDIEDNPQSIMSLCGTRWSLCYGYDTKEKCVGGENGGGDPDCCKWGSGGVTTTTPTGTTGGPSTGTPTQPPAGGQCSDIRIKKNGSIVTDFSTLRAGDVIDIEVRGVSATKGRIRVNGGTWTEATLTFQQTGSDPATWYVVPNVTLPSGVTSVTIEAEVYINGAWK
jgi:hypothetical protein